MPTPPFPLASLPADLFTTPIPDSTDHAKVAKECLSRLAANDSSVIASSSAHWRDILALTSTLRTFTNGAVVKAAWKELTTLHEPHDFEFEEGSSNVMKMGPLAFINAKFHFTNGLKPVGRCLGVLKIAPERLEDIEVDGVQKADYKIWALTTVLESIDGYGDPDVFPPHLLADMKHTANARINGMSHPHRNSTNTKNRANGDTFDALVVGLGPSGLANIARLKALNLNAIACDKIPEVGLNWTERYESLRLHTPKLQNSLPFNFKPPKDAPYYLGVNDLKQYYQSFVDEYKLKESLWLSTTVEHASWNKSSNSWTVTLTQSGRQRTVSTRHIVFCLGVTGRIPKQPKPPGRDSFLGVVLHAVDYTTSDKWAGKRGIVIGTANTGHDVAEDMANAGMHVTMVQRSRTPVLDVEKLPMHQVYHERADVTDVDKWFHTNPIAIERVLMRPLTRLMAEQDKEKFDKLEEKGFMVDREADLPQILYERAGRHYLDVGVSQMVIDGKGRILSNISPPRIFIKMKSGSPITKYTTQGLRFADGTELPADIIVFATGYEADMKLSAAKLLDPEVADKLDECWFLDEEGNLRGSWKPIGHPNVWFCPGDISHSRFFSRFVALQIKAEVEGTPFLPYDKRL